jgi:hypothetical protein
MNVLIKVGAGMALLAALMTSGFYVFLKAEGSNSTTSKVTAADRMIKDETRSISAAITQIEVSGPVKLTLRQGVTPSLMVRSEQRHLSKISTDQSGNTLSIAFNTSTLHNRNPIEVEVTLPELQKLSLRGSGKGQVMGFKGAQLELALNGSGDLELDGEYKNINANLRGSGDLSLSTSNSDKVELDIIGSGNITAKGQSKSLVTQLNGSGDISAEQLLADIVNITLNGSGNTDVHAKQSVNVNLRGSGDVMVRGQPQQRTITKHGSGDVNFE